MKIRRYISILPALLLFLVGCSDDLGKTHYNPENVISSKFETVGESYILDINAPDAIVDTFKWGKMDFGYPAAIKYTVEVDLAGQDFKWAQPVAEVAGTEVEVVAKSLNTAVLAAMKAHAVKFEEDTAVDVEFRIKASISEATTPIYSLNTQESKVTPYFVAEYPEELFMIGQQFGNWDWSSDGVVEFTPVHSLEGTFWAVRYLEAGSGFKFNTIKDWDGSFALLGHKEGVYEDEGNAMVSKSGYYMIFVNFTLDALIVQPAEVYGIGDAFGGWDSATYPFTVDGNNFTITTKHEGNLRMYATSPYAEGLGIDWWRMEFMLFDGKIKYRGTAGDLNEVSVLPVQVVTIDFNTGTGTIK